MAQYAPSSRLVRRAFFARAPLQPTGASPLPVQRGVSPRAASCVASRYNRPQEERDEDDSERVVGRAVGGAGGIGTGGPARRRRSNRHRGAVRAVEDGAVQLGAVGRRRRDRRGEPHHPREAPAGGGAGRGRHHRVPGRRRRHRRGRRQPQSLRARDGRDQLGPHRGPLPRHLPHPSRRARPRQRRRRLLQRLRARRRHRGRARPREELHPQPEERHRDPRRPHRHPPAAGRAVPGAGDADLRRGPGGRGKSRRG